MFSRIRNLVKEHNELKYLAFHDILTGLLNRNWLYKNIDQLKYNYVHFIDINNLHEINKSGHTVGDEYIKAIVKSIVLHDNDVLVRYAGDEFILFSNRHNAAITNNKYTVGTSVITNTILNAIIISDGNMLKQKRFEKTQERGEKLNNKELLSDTLSKK